MRLRAALTFALLVALALSLGACGEDGTTAAGDPPAAASQPQQPSEKRPPPAPAGACHAQVGGFVGAMASLRGDLARGLSYDEYLPEVRRVRAAYDRLPAARLSPACLLLAGGPAERAFNLYIDAANNWGDCLATPRCATTFIEPKLQKSWAQASELLTKAQHATRAEGRSR